jgi:PAS domain S-box-containing protein
VDQTILILDGRAADSAQVENIRDAARHCDADIERCDSSETVSAALGRIAAARGSALLVVGPDVDRPFAIARRLAKQHPDLPFLFAVEPAREAELRGEAMFAAPAGCRWSMVRADAGNLATLMAGALAAARQQRRLRTTLDRMTLRLASPAPVDSQEYRRLIASDRYLASVLSHAHDGIVSLDTSGRVVLWNRGAERLFGLSAEQAMGTRLSDHFTEPADVEAALRVARRAEFVVNANGATRYVDITFDAIADDDGTVMGAVAILRDTTDRNRAEQALRDSSRQKDEFLAMLAHELRNPLAPIRSAAEILSRLKLDDARAVRAADIIGRQVGHMTGLLDDLLDIARVSHGAIELHREPLLVSIVASEAIEQASASISARRHHFSVTQGSETLSVDGDRKRLTQVLTNLLVNAAKYTPDGGHVSLVVSATAQDVVLSVSDDGIGMAPELQAQVFELFVQGARTHDRSQGGLGIGLALVKSLVELHGGSVHAASEGPGRGSTFEVRLPRRMQAHESLSVPHHSKPKPASAGRALKLMVVDDNADAAHMLGLLLEGEGHSVHIELDSRRVLQRTQQAPPDVFILDLGMPHVDGYELARRIRSRPDGAKPVLIALTGYGRSSDKAQALRAGFDHHLVKPLDADALTTLLRDLATAGS